MHSVPDMTMAYIVMAYVGMACVVMAYIVMASMKDCTRKCVSRPKLHSAPDIVMALWRFGLHRYGLCRYGLHSYGYVHIVMASMKDCTVSRQQAEVALRT